jgi:hypothetical protein
MAEDVKITVDADTAKALQKLVEMGKKTEKVGKDAEKTGKKFSEWGLAIKTAVAGAGMQALTKSIGAVIGLGKHFMTSAERTDSAIRLLQRAQGNFTKSSYDNLLSLATQEAQIMRVGVAEVTEAYAAMATASPQVRDDPALMRQSLRDAAELRRALPGLSGELSEVALQVRTVQDAFGVTSEEAKGFLYDAAMNARMTTAEVSKMMSSMKAGAGGFGMAGVTDAMKAAAGAGMGGEPVKMFLEKSLAAQSNKDLRGPLGAAAQSGDMREFVRALAGAAAAPRSYAGKMAQQVMGPEALNVAARLAKEFETMPAGGESGAALARRDAGFLSQGMQQKWADTKATADTTETARTLRGDLGLGNIFDVFQWGKNQAAAITGIGDKESAQATEGSNRLASDAILGAIQTTNELLKLQIKQAEEGGVMSKEQIRNLERMKRGLTGY